MCVINKLNSAFATRWRRCCARRHHYGKTLRSYSMRDFCFANASGALNKVSIFQLILRLWLCIHSQTQSNWYVFCATYLATWYRQWLFAGLTLIVRGEREQNIWSNEFCALVNATSRTLVPHLLLLNRHTTAIVCTGENWFPIILDAIWYRRHSDCNQNAILHHRIRPKSAATNSCSGRVRSSSHNATVHYAVVPADCVLIFRVCCDGRQHRVHAQTRAEISRVRIKQHYTECAYGMRIVADYGGELCDCDACAFLHAKSSLENRSVCTFVWMCVLQPRPRRHECLLKRQPQEVAPRARYRNSTGTSIPTPKL